MAQRRPSRTPKQPAPIAGRDRVYRTAPIGLCLLDRELRYLDINQRLADFHGVPIAAHIGRTVREIVPDIADQVEPILRRVLETGEPVVDLEYRASTPRKPTEKAYWLVSYYPISDADGAVQELSILVQDITDRKRAERELRRREDEFHEMVNQLPAILVFVDTEERYRFTSATYEQWFGLGPGSAKGRKLEEVLPPRTYQAIERQVKTALSGREVTFETEIARADGSMRHVDVCYVPRRDEAGAVIGFYALIHDITEQKRAEQTLAESEARYRVLVEHSADAICVLDADTGRFVDVNRKAVEMFGMTEEALLAVGPVGTSPPRQPDGRTSAEKVPEALAAASEGTQHTFEWTHRDSRGRDFPCEIRLVQLPAKGRNLFRGSISDITERRAAELARQRDRERLRVLLETTSAIPWEIDTVTRQFTYVGPQAVRLLGYELHEWYRDDFWEDHLHPEDRERAIYVCRKSEESMSDYEIEYRMIASDGRIVWIHDLVTVESADNVQKNVRGLMIDVTARKRAQLLQAGLTRVLEFLAKGEPLSDVLDELVRTIDRQQTGMQCSILLLDDDGTHLRHMSAPSLPKAYNDAIDGIAIGPKAGSCGSAAYGGERVIVSDTWNDPRWTAFRDLAVRHNLRACWSQPILSEAGKVLGTFAMYRNRPHAPSDAELALIEQAAYLAGVAIERSKAHQALRESEAALRKSHEDLQTLTGKLISAQEEEHRRLARELHDDLTQRLAALAIEAGKLEGALSSSTPEERVRLLDMKKQLVRLSEDVHGISRQLHPSIIDDLGLVDAITSECARFSEREGIQVEFNPRNIPQRLPRDVSLCFYRVVQEGLRNIAKHSRAQRAQISLAGVNGTLHLQIEDQGTGFDPARLRGKGGLGLASMEERVRLLDGRLSVRSAAGKGTIIELETALPSNTR